MFPKYHTNKFEATLVHLKNLTALSIDNINEAVAQAKARIKSGNKTVEQYFKDLENIRNEEFKPFTSVDNVFITVLTFVSSATSYLCSKFVSSHHTALNQGKIFPGPLLIYFARKIAFITTKSVKNA
jgi:hypothetical protein